MPFLPIAERELRVAARKGATYHTRFWAVLIILVVFTWQFLWLAGGLIPPAMHGKTIFVTLSTFAFFYCLLIGARVTADCLSEEKREGTLGLLFLTDLKGYDIVFGKLVSSSINAVYGLLAIFPVLGVCLMLGGVSFGQFAKTVLALLTTLFFSLAAGIFVSTYNRQERVAMFFTVVLIILFAVGPVFLVDQDLWPVWLLSPGLALLLAIDPSGGFSGMVGANAYWLGLTVTWSITALFLGHASLKLPNSWQEKEPKPLAAGLKSFQLPLPDRAAASNFRERALCVNPYFWLALRGREKVNHTWGFVIAVIVTWLLGFFWAGGMMFDYDFLRPSLMFIHGFLKIWVTSEACTRLVQDRRSGALELLLSTPLGVKDIIRGQHLALRRQFAGPFSLLLFLEVFCFLSVIVHRDVGWRERLFVPTAVILLVADIFTLRWVAMWVGLNARNVNRALIQSGMLVLALPWIVYGLLLNFIPYFSSFSGGSVRTIEIFKILSVLCWVGIALLTDWILFRWAKTRLLTRFRVLATQPVGSAK